MIALKNWFKASTILLITGGATVLLDAMYAIQLDAYVGYGKIPFFGYYPNPSLFIFLLSVFALVLAYFAFLMGAKPVLNRELLGKKRLLRLN